MPPATPSNRALEDASRKPRRSIEPKSRVRTRPHFSYRICLNLPDSAILYCIRFSAYMIEQVASRWHREANPLDPGERRRLGSSDVQVTCFGFGGAPLGERFVRVNNAEADAIIETAYAAGINYFDTAPQYGQGKSEARLGRILQTKPRKSYVLSTKVGHLYEPPADPETFAKELRGNGLHFVAHSDYTSSGVMRSYEHSLLRLGLNRIDMLVIHDLDLSHHRPRDKVDWHFRELLEGGGWTRSASSSAAERSGPSAAASISWARFRKSSTIATSISSWWRCHTLYSTRVLSRASCRFAKSAVSAS